MEDNTRGDMAQCPGCQDWIGRHVIACKNCWRRIPGALKAELTRATDPRLRKSIINRMRQALR